MTPELERLREHARAVGANTESMDAIALAGYCEQFARELERVEAENARLQLYNTNADEIVRHLRTEYANTEHSEDGQSFDADIDDIEVTLETFARALADAEYAIAWYEAHLVEARKNIRIANEDVQDATGQNISTAIIAMHLIENTVGLANAIEDAQS